MRLSLHIPHALNQNGCKLTLQCLQQASLAAALLTFCPSTRPRVNCFFAIVALQRKCLRSKPGTRACHSHSVPQVLTAPPLPKQTACTSRTSEHGADTLWCFSALTKSTEASARDHLRVPINIGKTQNVATRGCYEVYASSLTRSMELRVLDPTRASSPHKSTRLPVPQSASPSFSTAPAEARMSECGVHDCPSPPSRYTRTGSMSRTEQYCVQKPPMWCKII